MGNTGASINRLKLVNVIIFGKRTSQASISDLVASSDRRDTLRLKSKPI